MKDGIYEARFSTSEGAIGTAAVMVKGRSFVGSDALQFFRGEIDHHDGEVRVIMEVTRHNFVTPSAFGPEAIFTLAWHGLALPDHSFRLGCKPTETDFTIFVSGRLLKSFD